MATEIEIVFAIKRILMFEDIEILSDHNIAKWLYENDLYFLLLKYGMKNPWLLKANIKYILNKVSLCKRLNICAPFLSSLAENKIPYAIVKGAVLSTMAFGNPFFRCSSDIDILVDKNDMSYVFDLLKKAGFTQGRIKDNSLEMLSREDILFHTLYTHQSAPFILQTDDDYCRFVVIDINFSLFWGEYTGNTCLKTTLDNTTDIVINDVFLKKLNVEYEFIELCLHHYKDCNSLFLLSTNGLRLSHFVDIYMYLKNTSLNINVLKEIAINLGAEKYVYYCLYYTFLLFDDVILKKYLEAFSFAMDEILLYSYGLNENERKTWDISFFNRLFHPNIKEYIFSSLTPEEKKRIEINLRNMYKHIKFIYCIYKSLN